MITSEKLLLYLVPTANELLTPQQYNNAINSIKEYAKQLLSDYTDKIVENVLLRQTNYKGSHTSEGSIPLDDYTDITVDKESITKQLEPFLKKII